VSDDEPLISVEDLTIRFEESQGLRDLFTEPPAVEAVSDVSLDIYEDDVVALVGESGCGKTTLGKSMIGIHRPASGSIQYKGQDIWDSRDGNGDVDIPFADIRRALQIIHQDPSSALNPNKRVISSLSKPLKRWNSDLSRVDREERIFTLLKKVGMEPAHDYANRYPHQLSGGEKQRVALIRALLMNPDLILADEAISALDVSLRVEMMDLLLELQDVFATSFLFISHDLANARYLAEKADGRIGVMYLGELVEIGPVDQVINNPKHPYTKVLRWATPNLALDEEDHGPPMRKIDIPDPVDPPSGCRFHTRCPEAREVCRRECPAQTNVGDGHEVACFREEPEHEYWESGPLEDDAALDDPTVGD